MNTMFNKDAIQLYSEGRKQQHSWPPQTAIIVRQALIPKTAFSLISEEKKMIKVSKLIPQVFQTYAYSLFH